MSGHSAAFSSGDAVLARMAPVTPLIVTFTSGLAVRLRYHCGSRWSPPLDAISTTRLSSWMGEVSMVVRGSPDLRPIVSSSTPGIPKRILGPAAAGDAECRLVRDVHELESGVDDGLALLGHGHPCLVVARWWGLPTNIEGTCREDGRLEEERAVNARFGLTSRRPARYHGRTRGTRGERAITDPTGRTVTFSPMHRPRRRGTRTPRRARTPSAAAALARALLAAFVIVIGAAASVGIAAATASAPAASAANWSPVHAGDFPDPSVLYWSGVYYGFATQDFAAPSQTINIQVSTSLNGVDWTQTGIDALPTLPSWAEKGDTWAPSVAQNSGGVFVMYYTATEASTGDQCIGVATSLLPTGPYTDSNAAPVVCDGPDQSSATLDDGNWGGSIDPDIFTDKSGTSWLLWKSDGNHMAVSTPIRAVQLTSNLLAPTGLPYTLLWDDEQWQSNIIEGPDMVETQTTTGSGTSMATTDSYYLFYAGSDEGASTYGIGWASCPAFPTTICTDMSTTPLLATSPGMSGPGGPDVFEMQPSGNLVMAFAAWQGSTIGYLSCGIRPMYLAQLSFAGPGGPPSLAPYTDTGPAGSPASRSRRARRPGTGRSAPTAASSPSGPPSSTARRAPCASTSPSSAWRRRPTATGTGS